MSAACAEAVGLGAGLEDVGVEGDAVDDGCALAGEVGFELGDHGQHVEQQPADGVVGVVDRSAEAEPDVAYFNSTASCSTRTSEERVTKRSAVSSGRCINPLLRWPRVVL